MGVERHKGGGGGYRLPFIHPPPTLVSKNNRSAFSNETFVTSEVARLLEEGFISTVLTPPRVVSPLSVVGGKKLRLVLDLSELNTYLDSPSFRIDDYKVLLPMLPESQVGLKFD